MFTNLDLLHLYRLLLGRHAEKNLKTSIFTQQKIQSRTKLQSNNQRRETKFTWSSHRKLSVTQLTHVVYTTLLRMAKFALHLGYSSRWRSKMAQKLVNFGQKIVTATPRLATRVSFQALGKRIECYLLVFTVCFTTSPYFYCVMCWKYDDQWWRNASWHKYQTHCLHSVMIAFPVKSRALSSCSK